jgi:hypothetical protein
VRSTYWTRLSFGIGALLRTGFAVFCGHAAVALIAGLILFRKRDA